MRSWLWQTRCGGRRRRRRMSERDHGLPSCGPRLIEMFVFRVDPRSYRVGDPSRPIGSTTTVGGELVYKWAYNTVTKELRAVWPSQHHKTVIGLEEWECSVRIIHDPVTHAILTRTVESSAGGSSPDSFGLQKQAFLAVSRRRRPALDARWRPVRRPRARDGAHTPKRPAPSANA